MIYAQIKNNIPTGIHKKFESTPPSEEWLPVEYGVINPQFDNIKQKVIPQRTIIENGTKVLYEEIIVDFTLEEVRNRKLEQLKIDRDKVLENGFVFNGKEFQTRNLRDITNLLGVGLGAIMSVVSSQTFSTDFISKDNTVVTMDAQTTLMFIQTMLTEAQSVWNRYNTKRELVNNADTVDDIIMVDF